MRVTTWTRSSFSGGGGSNCVEVAFWRKSSYSGGGGSDCVEVGFWKKSSFSDGGGTDCVEVALVPTGVAVRDSKNTAGPTLTFGSDAWLRLLRN